MNAVTVKIKKFLRQIVRASDFPAECLNSTPVIEIKGSEEATVTGVVRVVDYTLNEIVIDTCESVMIICGEKLTLYSLNRDKIMISGKIASVVFGGEAQR